MSFLDGVGAVVFFNDVAIGGAENRIAWPRLASKIDHPARQGLILSTTDASVFDAKVDVFLDFRHVIIVNADIRRVFNKVIIVVVTRIIRIIKNIV